MSAERPRVLVVDDESQITEIVSRWLEAAGFRCDTAHDGREAIEIVSEQSHDLVVVDVLMPGMSGIDLLEILRSRRPDVAVVMASGIDDRRTAIRALELGASGYLIKPLSENEVVINVANALERRRLRLLDQAYERQLEHDVREQTREIRLAREELCLMLIAASEYRDEQTGTHVRRMGLYAEALAIALGWGRDTAGDMRLAAPMHDVGKIGVPDRILLKPGPLSDSEFDVIKKHADIGARILSRSELPLLSLARRIARSHHERWDGSGYPDGLAGESIPAPARLVAIVDVYDALVHDRVYRPALSEAEALSIMAKGRGTHFDPWMFDTFIALMPRIRRIRIASSETTASEEHRAAELSRVTVSSAAARSRAGSSRRSS